MASAPVTEESRVWQIARTLARVEGVTLTELMERLLRDYLVQRQVREDRWVECRDLELALDQEENLAIIARAEAVERARAVAALVRQARA